MYLSHCKAQSAIHLSEHGQNLQVAGVLALSWELYWIIVPQVSDSSQPSMTEYTQRC